MTFTRFQSDMPSLQGPSKAAEVKFATMSADMRSQPSRRSEPGHVPAELSKLKPQVV